jgi:hypothetical protein
MPADAIPQITMAYGYWKQRRHEDPSIFEMHFRKTPFKGEFAIFAGIDEVRPYCLPGWMDLSVGGWGDVRTDGAFICVCPRLGIRLGPLCAACVALA